MDFIKRCSEKVDKSYEFDKNILLKMKFANFLENKFGEPTLKINSEFDFLNLECQIRSL